MAREDNFTGIQTFCCMCSKPIGEDRPKTAITCSPECTERRKQWRRSREDSVRCRYCLRPSTHAERARYQRWKRQETKNPPPDAELSPEEIAEREYKKANPPKKRGPKAKPVVEEEPAEDESGQS